MAWTAIEDFNSYSDGDVVGENGGSGWSGAWAGTAGVFDVQGTVVYEGAKAILNTSSSNISRGLTAVSGDGNVMYIAHRRTANNSGASRILLDAAASSRRVTIEFNSSGNIVGSGTTVQAYSANTWYVLKITLNTDADTFLVQVSTDPYGLPGTFSAGATCAMSGTSGADIVSIILDLDAGGDAYWDYISGQTPFTEDEIKSGWFL